MDTNEELRILRNMIEKQIPEIYTDVVSTKNVIRTLEIEFHQQVAVLYNRINKIADSVQGLEKIIEKLEKEVENEF
jgi:conjugal transfer/entry exclusion protein